MTELDPIPRRRLLWQPVLGLLVVVTAASALYFGTLYPGVGGRLNPGDSAKFQFIGQVLGIPHEPGYPQYVVLNWLWTRLPLPGSLAVRVNALSAVVAVVACSLLYLLAWRLSGRASAAALAVVAVTASQTLWTVATEAEVYTLHLAWVALVLVLGERWITTRRDRYLAWLFFAYAAGFGNHLAMVTLLPALALTLLVTSPRVLVRPRWIATALGAAVLGASQYAFVWLRAVQGAPYREALSSTAPTWEQFRAAVTGSRHTQAAFLASGLEHVLFERVGDLLRQAAVEFLFPLLLMATVGAVILAQRRGRVAVLLLGSVVGIAAFCATYEIPDWWVNAVPLWALTGVCAAVALGAALDRWPIAGRILYGIALASTAATIAYRLPELTVAFNPWDRGRLIDRAPVGAVVLTHAGDNYHAQQVTNYYTYGEPSPGRRGVIMQSLDEYVSSFEALRGRPVRFEDESVSHGFDRLGMRSVPRSYRQTLAEWAASRPQEASVLIGSAWLTDEYLRHELAAAIERWGDVEQLRQRGVLPCVAAAVGVGRALEVDVRADDALLTGEQVRGVGAGMSDVSQVFAGTAAEGTLVAFGTGGQRPIETDPAVHVLWRDRPDDPWSTTRFGLAPGLPQKPLYFERVPRPLRGPVRTVGGRHGAALVDAEAQSVSLDAPLVEAIVVDEAAMEFLITRRFEGGRGPAGLDGLARLVEAIDTRQTLLVLVPRALAVDRRALAGAVRTELGAVGPNASLVVAVHGDRHPTDVWRDPKEGTVVWPSPSATAQ